MGEKRVQQRMHSRKNKTKKTKSDCFLPPEAARGPSEETKNKANSLLLTLKTYCDS